MKSFINILYHILKLLVLFIAGGIIYCNIEILWRGYTHWTMFIVGGLCFISIGCINEFINEDMLVQYQALVGSIIITTIEYISGYIINIVLGWDVWDYSNLPLNIHGQVCLLFSIAWLFLGFIGILLDDYLRYLLFNEPMPKYKFKK